MTNQARFLSLLEVRASDAIYHREDAGVNCPCLTPEGFRDPIWHIQHPTGQANPDLAPIWGGVNPPPCNEAGLQIVTAVNVSAKAFVQPIQSTRATRLSTEYLTQMFGEVQQDDHLGIFPLAWSGVTLDFYDWNQAGNDFVTYDGRRFTVVNANKIPDPADGSQHHWEVGLRLIKSGRPV